MDEEGVELDGEVSTAKNLSNAEGALFMIPQGLTAWDPSTTGALSETNTGVYFLLNCQIMSGTNKDIQVWPSEAGETFADIAIPATALEWEQGKKYVYTFTFGEGAGYEPGTDPDPDPTLVGIDFTVTVDEFINATEEEITLEGEDGN